MHGHGTLQLQFSKYRPSTLHDMGSPLRFRASSRRAGSSQPEPVSNDRRVRARWCPAPGAPRSCRAAPWRAPPVGQDLQRVERRKLQRHAHVVVGCRHSFGVEQVRDTGAGDIENRSPESRVRSSRLVAVSDTCASASRRRSRATGKLASNDIAAGWASMRLVGWLRAPGAVLAGPRASRRRRSARSASAQAGVQPR